jgi:hypothetical protein
MTYRVALQAAAADTAGRAQHRTWTYALGCEQGQGRAKKVAKAKNAKAFNNAVTRFYSQK